MFLQDFPRYDVELVHKIALENLILRQQHKYLNEYLSVLLFLNKKKMQLKIRQRISTKMQYAQACATNALHNATCMHVAL